MMLFYFLIEAIFFLYTSVLPIAAHLVLLPVAFSVSYAAGLDATIQWTLYYWVLGSMRLVLPSFVVICSTTHLKHNGHLQEINLQMAPMAIATPLVALSPIGNILAAAAGQPDKISAQWKFFRMSASTILNHAPAGLALIEGMAAIILIRTLGRRMKEELHGTVRVRRDFLFSPYCVIYVAINRISRARSC
ncbi:hypothetical protein BC828DRAFT_81426 [Blastocladiella britannica]|nr:hypothetical protein BC828DRAFT_81426 [Blastocladiella britannica]